ncbi:transposase [Vibrio sp. ER1A]|uniref:transposase n=1 Tax=Vibrio sp. ER1A TaxID=1517681 RepID=UPI00190FB3B6|nr:transposase [Vibrio sp. ER1A]
MIPLVLLAQRWNFLNDQVKSLDKEKKTLNTAQSLVSRFGVGANVTETLLVAVGDNANRLKKESSFAALCGGNPIPASSGKTTRHRLNRGACRSANNVLWTVAMVRCVVIPDQKTMSPEEQQKGYQLRK